MASNPDHSKPISPWLTITVLSVSCLAVFILWLLFTPAGLTHKLQAIAYSVCHENPDHSLSIGSMVLPLCARCTGMYLGCLVGLVSLRFATRGAGYPSKGIRWALGALVLFFTVDGINSAAFSYFDGKALYTPTNVLRLISGLGMGLVLAAVLLLLWRQSIMQQSEDTPGLTSWLQMGMVFLVEGLLAVLILFAPGWLYSPLAILSVLAVPFLLTMVYTLLWILMRKKENSLRNLQQRFTYILLGCLTAFIQISAFDLLRYMVTGSWTGIRF